MLRGDEGGGDANRSPVDIDLLKQVLRTVLDVLRVDQLQNGRPANEDLICLIAKQAIKRELP